MIFKHGPYNQYEDNILAKLQDQFKSEFKLSSCFGTELEFYIHGEIDIKILATKINHKIYKEKGHNQYEINLKPSDDVLTHANDIKKIRQDIISHANNLGVIADFNSKPFANDYGSSMHVHLNFLEDNNIEKYAEILCHYMPHSLDYFLPKPEDYKRLDSKFMAPTHICYGGNNRTVAIRIPDSKPKRLEHRLAGANADPHNVLYIILKSIKDGIQKPEIITPCKKIFGNSFDKQYGLKKIL